MRGMKNVGGHGLAAFFGTGTVAYFASLFIIGLLGYIGIGGLAGYTVTNPFPLLIGIFSFATASIIFVIVWAAMYLGYIGIAFHKRGR